MKKLWQKDEQGLEVLVETFETKDDIALDQKLIPYDIEGSLAHAKMLVKIGILSKKELTVLEKGLKDIQILTDKGEFVLQMGDEDVHTKIEQFLTEHYGEVGKKIHTARSRNDQVLTALRLFSKAELEKIQEDIAILIKTFASFKKHHGRQLMPGYTHMQKAMPSSLGLWAGSFIAALEDDLTLIKSTYGLIDQSPLGSAAGYGLPINIDRKYTAKLLQFKTVQENPIYCQQSRGKFDASVVASLVQILLTINKFATDVLLFTTQEFGFFTASSAITTGSSIMPQKKNVDLAELLRSKVHIVLGHYMQIVSLSSNLTSGYNRDLQDSKKSLMESLEITSNSLKVAKLLLENIQPNAETLKTAMTDDLYATEKALALVLKGESFRDAYLKIGKQYSKKK